MILKLKAQTKAQDVEQVVQMLNMMHLQSLVHCRDGQYDITIVSDLTPKTKPDLFHLLPHVEQVVPVTPRYKLASKVVQKNKSVIDINGHQIGGNQLIVIAGSCSVESEAQIFTTAQIVAEQGAQILRGGAFKPRTSPYDFQGLGEVGLRYLNEAARAHNLLCISEIMDTRDLDLVARYVDIVQIGSRNMQNFSLLKEVGQVNKPILLKRGLSATYQEFLLAAEYILSEGNAQVILCERGIRTFETYSRNTLDLAAVPIVQQLSHLPIIVDPSHGTGRRELILPMSKAAVAAGADGLMIEMHPQPDQALSDAQQTIGPELFNELMHAVNRIHAVV